MQQRFEQLLLDLFGPLPEGERGLRWIFIVKDTTTRWVELFPLAQTAPAACVDVLGQENILRFAAMTICLGIHQAFTPV